MCDCLLEIPTCAKTGHERETGAGDERIDKHHWEDTPRFGYAPAPFGEVAARHACTAACEKVVPVTFVAISISSSNSS